MKQSPLVFHTLPPIPVRYTVTRMSSFRDLPAGRYVSLEESNETFFGITVLPFCLHKAVLLGLASY